MWFVMSYNAIVGHVSGTFWELGNLFYAGPVGDGSIKWVTLLSEAKKFSTHEEAKAEITAIWEESFARSSFAYVEYDLTEPQEAQDSWSLSLAERKRETTAALSIKRLSKEDLVALTKESWRTNALTHREKWIIELFTEDGDT